MARKVIDEWAFGSVVREGPEEFVNFPGSFAEYLIKEAEESSKRCDLFVCNDIVVPGTDFCPAHQHADVCITHDGGITVDCACGEAFDSEANHAKHAANA